MEKLIKTYKEEKISVIEEDGTKILVPMSNKKNKRETLHNVEMIFSASQAAAKRQSINKVIDARIICKLAKVLSKAVFVIEKNYTTVYDSITGRSLRCLMSINNHEEDYEFIDNLFIHGSNNYIHVELLTKPGDGYYYCDKYCFNEETSELILLKKKAVFGHEPDIFTYIDTKTGETKKTRKFFEGVEI